MDGYVRDFFALDVNTCLVDHVEDFNANYSALLGNFKIFHVNIRSIAENLDELLVYLRQFACQFEVIVLTESFKIDNLCLYSLEGYTVLYNEGNVNRNDGVVVYVKNGITFEHRIVCLTEIKILQVIMKVNNRKILISAVYRPNPTCPYVFNADLHKYLASLTKDIDYSVFIGDINIDILGNEIYEQDYLNILYQDGFISQVNKYTRVDGNSRSCIDHIFVKKKRQVGTSLTPVIFRNLITDHYPIALIMDFEGPSDHIKLNLKHRVNYSALKQKLSNTSWVSVYESQNVDDMTNIFVNILKENINQSTVEYKIRKCETPRKAWITSGLLKSIRVKNDLYTELLKKPI